MNDTQPLVPIEALLAHEGWVRGLARSLVLDASSADDVIQETWLTAIRRPPRAGGSVRAWLASVVRSRAADAQKRDRRRHEREGGATQPEATPGSVADAVAATETHRRVVAAVMSLDEPYRSALLLRFFEGLPPREIGARVGVPAETARTRVHRGLAMLRTHFDAESGGDRRAWTAALLPIAGLGDGSSAPDSGTSGRAGGRARRMVVAASALVAAAGAFWFLRTGTSTQSPGEGEEPTAMGDAASDTWAGGRAPRQVASGAESGSSADAQVPTPSATPRGAVVRLRFLDESGAPLAPELVRARWGGSVSSPVVLVADDRILRSPDRRGAMLQFVGAAPEALHPVKFSDAAGGVELTGRVPEGRWCLVVLPGAAPATRSKPFDVAADGAADVDIDVVLAAADLRRVRVVDAATDTPLAGARIVPRFTLGNDAAPIEGPAVVTDAAGECLIPQQGSSPRTGITGPAWCVTTSDASGVFRMQGGADRPAPAATSPGDAAENPAASDVDVWRVAAKFEVTGIAVLRDGAPAAGRTVCWLGDGAGGRTTCDAEGRFRLDGLPSGDWPKTVMLVEDVAAESVRCLGVIGRPGDVRDVRIGGASVGTARIVVRVTVGGRPVAGVAIIVTTPSEEMSEMSGVVAIESQGAFGTTDADGGVTLEGLPQGVALWVRMALGDLRIDQELGGTPESFQPLGGGEERRLDLDLPPGVARVRVVDASSRAVAGVPVTVRPAAGDDPAPAGWRLRFGDARFTDADGVALVVGLPAGRDCAVSVGGGTGAATSATVVPGTWDRPGDVTVTVGR